MSKWGIEETKSKLENIISSQYDKFNYCYARYKNDINIDLETNSEINYYTFSGFDYKQDSDLFRSAYFNVTKSVIDSIVSKLANQKVRPFFTPVNGTYKTRRVVKQCQTFFDTYFDNQKVHTKVVKAFLESCIFGVGYIYVNPITYQIDVIPSWCVATLNTESVFGNPTKMLVRYNNFPTTLLSEYDIKEDNSDREYITFEQYIDTKAHVYKIYINGVEVKSIDYKADVLPLVQLRWNNSVMGNFSSSIVEELDGLQTQIDLISSKISAASQLTPANTTYVLEGSNLTPGDINNRVGNVYGVKCPPGMNTIPVMNVTPSPIDPYWQTLMEYYVQKAYEMIGISQLSAMSQKPQGADSGVALQTLEDVESDRFEQQVINFVQAFMDLAKVLINVIPEEADILPSDNYIKSFKWKDVVKARDLFKLQYSAQSALSKDPQEKLKQVLQLREQGFLSNYEVPIYLDLPDLQSAYEGAQAIENAIDALIDDCIENGTTDVPEFIDYEQLAQRIVIVENQFAASYTGKKKEDQEVDEAITNLRALEDNLMTIMEQNGFIASEQTQELGDEKTAANVTKSLSGGKDISQTMQPNNAQSQNISASDTIEASETMNEEPVNDSVANEADQFAQ